MPAELNQLAAQLVLRLVSQVLIRQFCKLKRIASVKHDAGVGHLVKLDRKDVARVREFFYSEVDGQRMAESLPLAHRRLGQPQIFRRDAVQSDEQVVV